MPDFYNELLMPTISEKIQHIQQQLHSENHDIAVGLLSQLNVADQARILSRLDARQQAQILRELNESSLVYAFMPLGQQLNVTKHLSISDHVPDVSPLVGLVLVFVQTQA
jgi:magnesium transporter